VSNVTPHNAITGKVTASPNPIPLGAGGCTKIDWVINDPRGGEIRVSTPTAPEKLVASGLHGSVEIPWISAAQLYTFALYGMTEPDRRVDHVTVRRSTDSWASAFDQLATDVSDGAIDLREVADLVGRVVRRCVQNARFPEFFRLWEQQGIHITPVHFYYPIPETCTLPEGIWNRPNELSGIDMNDSVQLELLRNSFPRFRGEYAHFAVEEPAEGGRFYFDNGRFSGTDALVAYCMVRHFRPQTIIEIGSGYSSLISGEAAAKNGTAALVCVEPFPLDFLEKGFPGLRSLVKTKVEDLGLEFFDQLQSGDVLFIDSSHVCKIGGDVNYLFLEILPRLRPGVIVHIHDIYFPFEYPREWVVDECRFWTEQYLLQAFLAFNSDFEVLFANSYMAFRYLAELKATFPTSPWWGGGSFWIRRRLLPG
jgi:hypothetical protein